MPRYRGLAVVGKDLDHALVNEHPQGEVLSLLQQVLGITLHNDILLLLWIRP